MEPREPILIGGCQASSYVDDAGHRHIAYGTLYLMPPPPPPSRLVRLRRLIGRALRWLSSPKGSAHAH